MMKKYVQNMAGDVDRLTFPIDSTVTDLKELLGTLREMYTVESGRIKLSLLGEKTFEVLADERTIVSIPDDIIYSFINRYSDEDLALFNRYKRNDWFFLNIINYNKDEIVADLSTIFRKLPEFFDWIDDHHISHLVMESNVHYVHNRDDRYIFSEFLTHLSKNRTLRTVTIPIFFHILSADNYRQLQQILDQHPTCISIYFSCHDAISKHVVKFVKHH